MHCSLLFTTISCKLLCLFIPVQISLNIKIPLQVVNILTCFFGITSTLDLSINIMLFVIAVDTKCYNRRFHTQPTINLDCFFWIIPVVFNKALHNLTDPFLLLGCKHAEIIPMGISCALKLFNAQDTFQLLDWKLIPTVKHGEPLVSIAPALQMKYSQ